MWTILFLSYATHSCEVRRNSLKVQKKFEKGRDPCSVTAVIGKILNIVTTFSARTSIDQRSPTHYHDCANIFVVLHAIICFFDFLNFMLFIIKFINFKPIIKFKKFELHNCDVTTSLECRMLHAVGLTRFAMPFSGNIFNSIEGSSRNYYFYFHSLQNIA